MIIYVSCMLNVYLNIYIYIYIYDRNDKLCQVTQVPIVPIVPTNPAACHQESFASFLWCFAPEWCQEAKWSAALAGWKSRWVEELFSRITGHDELLVWKSLEPFFIFPYFSIHWEFHSFIIPTDQLIFFRGVGQPPTRLLMGIFMWFHVCVYVIWCSRGFLFGLIFCA